MTAASDHLSDLAAFVEASPSSYHAAAEAVTRLKAAGFTELDEREPFTDVSGDRFVRRHGAVVAWRAPEKLTRSSSFRIVGAHTDSPAFKVKPTPMFTSAGWTQVAVEVYGGPLLNSWLDRELGLAGRIVTLDGDEHLVQTGSVLRIPQLAVHLDRQVNTEGLKLDAQAHTQPICAIGDADVLQMLADQAKVKVDDIGYHDLYTFTTQKPARFGVRDEFLASSRLDNLSSTQAGLVALLSADLGSDISVFVAFDHEEIGSGTTSGAQGTLLGVMLHRIAAGFGLDLDATLAMWARSLCVSADAGHLVHPNYVAKHDPHNQPQPGGGPLLKINAQQRYATDASGGAAFARACKDAGVPMQYFVSNNTMPCGSTIGPITASRLGIATVDVGIGLLSMHSAREMCAADDPWLLTRALTAFYSA